MGSFAEIDLEIHEENISKDGFDDSAFSEDGVDTADTVGASPQKSPVETAPAQAAPVPSPTDTSESTEEEKRRALEESEAKRKAEFEARQLEKKAAFQKKLDLLNAMSDEEVMAASMKRVSEDTEKLTRRNMKECVVEHIQTLCIEDPALARKAMHPRKSMVHCFQYISRKAWEYVQDELKANGIQPGQGSEGYGCDVPDGLCYQWAVDYFNDPDAKEDKEEEEKFVPNPYRGSSTSKPKGSEKDKTKAKAKKPEAPKKPDKPASDSGDSMGQISFGDFMMPEEKAG